MSIHSVLRGRTRAAGLAVLVLVVAASTLSCQGMRYGMSNWMRPGTDYDAIDAERGPDVEVSAQGAGSPEEAASSWSQYRGVDGSGVAAADSVGLGPGGADAAPPEMWRVRVGPAYSSVVVAGDLVITMEQRRDHECIAAFAFDSGEPVWEHSWPDRFYEAMSKEGPRGTPAVKDGRVVAVGAKGEVRCLDVASGELLWRRDLLEEEGKSNIRYGLSASPRILGDVVVVQGARSVHGLGLADGAVRWRALDEAVGYATPTLGDVLGKPTWIVSTANRIVGVDVETGAEEWSFPWRVFAGLSITQPIVVGPDRILVSAGYGKGSKLVSLARGSDGVEVTEVWRSKRFKTRFNEPVLVGDLAYGLDEGRLACLEVETGKTRWKSGRYGYGQLIAVGDRLLVIDEDGMIHVLIPGPEGAEEIGRFQGPKGETALNLPALARGRLLVRNEKYLACYDLRPEPEM